jgi:hypothetical protein
MLAASNPKRFRLPAGRHNQAESEVTQGRGTMSNDDKLDRLCRHCGQAFSVFLQEMAEHNAKVAACPKCGKVHDHKHPKAEKPVALTRHGRKIVSKIIVSKIIVSKI